MRAYFEDSNSSSSGARLVTLFMLLLGIVGLLAAEQIFTGWLPLGERANISRRDRNELEWAAMAAGVLYGIAALRTTWGLINRERSSWAWTQWMSFITIIIGIVFLMAAVLPSVVDFATGDDISAINSNTITIGIVLFVLSLIGYVISTQGISFDDAKVDKKQGALSTATSDMSPSAFIRFQLSKSPGAGAIIGFVGIFLAFSMTTDLFLEPTSIASILTNVATKGIVAIGVTILMISGEFDLSVGSMLGAVSLFFMLFMTEGIDFLGIAPMPTLVAIVAALLVACFMGFINGFLLVRTGIPSFIVTLGTLLIYRAIPLVAIPGGRILRYRDYYNEFPIIQISPWFFIILCGIGLLILALAVYRTLPRLWHSFMHKWQIQHNNGDFGTVQAIFSGLIMLVFCAVVFVFGAWLALIVLYHLDHSGELVKVGIFDIANGRWGFTFNEVTRGLINIQIPIAANFRNSIIWWLIMVGIFHVILTRTPYGNAVFAVGGNAGAARAQGINVNRIKVFNFMLVAFLVGIAAIFEVARNPGVDPQKGQGLELEVIAMTVIGGALLSGGYGSLIGTLMGAMIVAMLQTGLVLIGMNARLFEGVVGFILIVAVVLNTSVRRIPKS